MPLSVGWWVVREEPVYLKVARQLWCNDPFNDLGDECQVRDRSVTLEIVRIEIVFRSWGLAWRWLLSVIQGADRVAGKHCTRCRWTGTTRLGTPLGWTWAGVQWTGLRRRPNEKFPNLLHETGLKRGEGFICQLSDRRSAHLLWKYRTVLNLSTILGIYMIRQW